MLFADGTVAMTVVERAHGRARLRVTLPGRVRSRQGLNLPRTDLAVSSLTDKDLHDLDWTAQHADDIDFVALSFVRSPEDVVRLRRELQSKACTAGIVVKIEKPQAMQHLEAIVAATDAVMVARLPCGTFRAIRGGACIDLRHRVGQVAWPRPTRSARGRRERLEQGRHDAGSPSSGRRQNHESEEKMEARARGAVPLDPVPPEYGQAFGMFRFRTQGGDAPVLRLLWRKEDNSWRVTPYDVELP